MGGEKFLTKICPNCGNELKDDAKFCNKCGSKLNSNNVKSVIKHCPNCGKEVSGDGDFCNYCGNSLNKTRIQAISNNLGLLDKVKSLNPKQKRILYLAIIIIVACLLVLSVYAITSSNNSSNQELSNTDSSGSVSNSASSQSASSTGSNQLTLWDGSTFNVPSGYTYDESSSDSTYISLENYVTDVSISLEPYSGSQDSFHADLDETLDSQRTLNINGVSVSEKRYIVSDIPGYASYDYDFTINGNSIYMFVVMSDDSGWDAEQSNNPANIIISSIS